jgi:hypothetical protein
LGGLAVAFTDSPGHRPVAEDVGEGAILYQPGDIATLSSHLKRWAEDKAALLRARMAAWQAAKRRWNWGHPQESGQLLERVAEALN